MRTKKPVNKPKVKQTVQKSVVKPVKVLVEETKEKKREKEIQRYLELVNEIRGTDNDKKINKAFNEMLSMLNAKIQQVVYKTKIPGYGFHDIYQEALYALRYKAIKDYNPNKSTKMKVAAFDSFAILCIRRFLSTRYKSSWQNKSRSLNSAVSINQEKKDKSGNEESVNLEEVLTKNKAELTKSLRKKEDFKALIELLSDELSELEKKVLGCYSKDMSYFEIAKRVYGKQVITKADAKSIDNSLSRIKAKAKAIYKSWIEDYG